MGPGKPSEGFEPEQQVVVLVPGKTPRRVFGWLVGGWVGGWVGLLVGWFVGCLTGWRACCFVASKTTPYVVDRSSPHNDSPVLSCPDRPACQLGKG